MTLQDNLNEALKNHGLQDEDGVVSILEERHPSSIHMLKVCAPNPNLQGILYDIADDCFGLALNVFSELPDGPELTAGLRKLVEAKDCFVRGYLDTEPVDYRDR